MAYFILVIALFGTFAFGVISSAGIAGLTYMLNIPSFILVIIPAITITILSKTSAGVNPFSVLFSSRENVDREKAVITSRFFHTFGNSFITMGFIAFFISFILLLRSFPDPKAFGPPFAIGLISLLYALFWKVLAYTAEQHVLQKANIGSGALKSDFREWSVYLYALLPMAYWSILVLYMSK